MTHASKKILIVGQGGREHALVKAFKQNPTYEVHIAPGNDGMTGDAICHPEIKTSSNELILQLCREHQFEFVFIGPEDPLVNGLSNFLRAHQIAVVGPNQEAAQLEGSKIFAKEFMRDAGIPTAHFVNLHSVHDVKKHLSAFTPPYVFKYDGLAAGKGVIICQTEAEVLSVAEKVFIEKLFGENPKAILEQHLTGYELSYLFITNGNEYSAFPLAQDHKRLFENEQGPNTGGMGTVAPLKISADLEKKIQTQVIIPTLKLLTKRGMLYRGIVFLGLMIDKDQPWVLEYNVRLGDPETQVILPLLKNDFAQVCTQLAHGHVENLNFNNLHATCVIGAAQGYPDSPVRNTPIQGDLLFQSKNSYIIASGVKKTDAQQWLTNGGRVLGYVGLSDNFEESRKTAYALIAKVNWSGMQFRKDIGTKINS